MAEREERKPLFKLDLGKNGGVFAPYTGEELVEWIGREVQFWNWLPSAPGYSHKSSLDNAYNNLAQALASAQRYLQGNDLVANLGDAQARVRSTFLDMRLPQSSTAMAKVAEKLRLESPERAVAYVFAQLPNPNNFRFESNTPAAWHAYILGLFSAYGGLPGIDRANAERAALEDVLADGKKLLADRRTEYDTLYTDLKFAIAEGREQTAARATEFGVFMTNAKKEHDDVLEEHTGRMKTLQRAYLSDMSLRAPVEYWSERERTHKDRTKTTAKAFGVLLGSIAIAMWCAGLWAVQTSIAPATQPPDSWRLAVVAFVAAVGVWLLRLVVRMFLSDLHLATDAAERVTMVKTYLALVSDDKVPQDEDRKLILQALFRPTSDGIVKDDGLPNPVLDALTRPKP